MFGHTDAQAITSRACLPHLEVTDVGPEADPAHVLQEHIQGVPCPAGHSQRCLPIPLQCPLVLLQPQGLHFCPVPGSLPLSLLAARHNGILLPVFPAPAQAYTVALGGTYSGQRAGQQRFSMAHGTS